MILKTARLILRPWTEEDADALYRYAHNPEVALSAGWMPHPSVEHSREIIRLILCRPTVFAVCLMDGAPIGNIHLDPDTPLGMQEDEWELGYWLGQPYWGQGIMTEAGREMVRHAFEDCGVSVLYCGYFDGNTRSRRVQEKLGFVETRTDWVPDFTDPTKIHAVHRTYLDRRTWEKHHDL